MSSCLTPLPRRWLILVAIALIAAACSDDSVDGDAASAIAATEESIDDAGQDDADADAKTTPGPRPAPIPIPTRSPSRPGPRSGC